MKKFKVTYRNNRTGLENSITGFYRNLESATAEENKSMAIFQRVNPALVLVSIEAI
jgi:hypothetical protein